MSIRDIDLNPDLSFGVGFPLNYDSETYGFFKQNYSYYEQIQDNIKCLLMTGVGERPMLPEFGSRLKEIVFEQNEPEILKAQVEEAIKEALELFLPFVTLVSAGLQANGNTLNIIGTFSSEFTEEVVLTLSMDGMDFSNTDEF